MFFSSVLNNQPIKVHNGGMQTRSFTWISDTVDGFYRAGLMDTALDGTALIGGAFNIGSTEEISIKLLQQAVFDAVSKDTTWKNALPEVLHEDGYFGDALRRLPDCSQAELQLGWKATTSLEQGLASMWYSLR